jgi:hypothetical protein
MTEAQQVEFDEIEVPVKSVEHRHALRAAAGLYIRHLSDVAVEQTKLGKAPDAARYQHEADGLRADLLGDPPGEYGRLGNADKDVPVRILAAHRQALTKGLEFYLKNLRAARGTMKALDKVDLALDFEQEAGRVEAQLLPFFSEQGTLKLVPDDGGKSLKQKADELVEPE